MKKTLKHETKKILKITLVLGRRLLIFFKKNLFCIVWIPSTVKDHQIVFAVLTVRPAMALSKQRTK